jgi:uncharacterized protein (TIGR02598 family)
MSLTSRHRTNKSSGFSLIEVTLALGVAAFCLLSVFALLPMGLNSSQNASEQTAVAGIATAISADLHATPMTGGTTSRLGFVIPAAGRTSVQSLFFAQDASVTGIAGANAVASGSAPSRYRATVTIQPDPTLVAINSATKFFKVWILITWPALADSNAANFPANFAGSSETLTSLDCN